MFINSISPDLKVRSKATDHFYFSRLRGWDFTSRKPVLVRFGHLVNDIALDPGMTFVVHTSSRSREMRHRLHVGRHDSIRYVYKSTSDTTTRHRNHSLQRTPDKQSKSIKAKCFLDLDFIFSHFMCFCFIFFHSFICVFFMYIFSCMTCFLLEIFSLDPLVKLWIWLYRVPGRED